MTREKAYSASVINKETHNPVRIDGMYTSKKEFIKKLRADGYKVNPLYVKTREEFDFIINKTDADLYTWKHVKDIMAAHHEDVELLDMPLKDESQVMTVRDFIERFNPNWTGSILVIRNDIAMLITDGDIHLVEDWEVYFGEVRDGLLKLNCTVGRVKEFLMDIVNQLHNPFDHTMVTLGKSIPVQVNLLKFIKYFRSAPNVNYYIYIDGKTWYIGDEPVNFHIPAVPIDRIEITPYTKVLDNQVVNCFKMRIFCQWKGGD